MAVYFKKTTFLFIMLVGIFSIANGQELKKEKILAKPEKFLLPKLYEGESRKAFINEKGRKSDDFWIVISDRNNNWTFDKAGGSGQKYKELKFGQIFYVIDQDKEWIELGLSEDGFANDWKTKLRNYGWIKKEKMLLWKNGLMTQNSIHVKAFLLNKLKQVEVNQSLVEAPYYHDPDFRINKTSATANLDLFSFYYIYKINYDDIGRPIAYLLGKESFFSPTTGIDQLLGWVSHSRVDVWNTRLALAPNFGSNAFPERKKDVENLRARGYRSYKYAIAYSKNSSGRNHNENIIWDQDPVKGYSSYLSSDPKRFNANVIRFPVLKYVKNQEYYRSGVLKEFKYNSESIDQVKVNSERQELFQNATNDLDNLNVFFLIDGTNSKFSKEIPTMVELLKSIATDTEQFSNIKTGVGVYKDCNSLNHFKRSALSNDVNKSIQFLQNTTWGKLDADDEYNCVLSAFWESLRKADFDHNATNVIIHIGDQPDIKGRKVRAKDVKIYSSDQKEIEVRGMASDLDVQIISMDYEHKIKDRASDFYQDYNRSLLNDIYKKMLREIDLEGISFQRSYLDDFEGKNEIQVTNFPYIYAFKKPQNGSTLSGYEISTFVSKKMNELKIQQKKTQKEAEIVEKEGIKKQPSSGVYSVEAIHIFRKALKKRDKGLSEEEILAMLKRADGTSWYAEVFLPSTSKAHGGNHDPWCYVMFLPSEDLKNYMDQLKKLVNAMDSPGDKKREILQETLSDLASTLTGEKSVKTLKKINIDEIEQRLAGIADQGLEIESRYDVKLNDITDDRKFSDNALNNFHKRIAQKLRILEDIYRDDEHEFMYDTGANKYYWIPFHDFF